MTAQDQLVASAPTPARAMVQAELAGELGRAVESLPRRHRDVILLRFFGEASLAEMASVLGCSVGTVKANYFHAIRNLRKSIGDHLETEGNHDHEVSTDSTTIASGSIFDRPYLSK